MPEPDVNALIERLDAWTARRTRLASRRFVSRAGLVPAVVIPTNVAAWVTYLVAGRWLSDRGQLGAAGAVYVTVAAAGYVWYRLRGQGRVAAHDAALQRSTAELGELTDPAVASLIPQDVWIRTAVNLGVHATAYGDAARVARQIVGRGAQAVTTEMFNVTGLERIPPATRQAGIDLADRLSNPRTATLFDVVHGAWRRHPAPSPASNAFAKPVPNPDSVFTIAWTVIEIDELLDGAPGADRVFATLLADAGGQAWDHELVEYAEAARDVCLPA